MKTKDQRSQLLNGPNRAGAIRPPRSRGRGRQAALLGAAVAGVLLAAQPAPAGDVFVIAMENHNFTQPNPTNSPQQILGNPAAPFLNSLVTPGHPNAAQVSFALAYANAGMHVHPSEPNYVWAEAGTDFGVHTDADPRAANGNTFYDQAIHFAALLNAAGIPWRNYQEDVELSASPTNSASGTNAPAPNPYYGTTQYNYAVKHNPMAFFSDTAAQNVYPLAQLFVDLASHHLGRYNWITPNQYNDAHSSLNGGFTYQGTHYPGDQSSIAQGDNFLATVIPQIMASPAYQDNGLIVIWWDESEDGDDATHTIPEIILSPLAKDDAYASAVPMNHSSDLKTLAEIFRLPALNNPIPATETNTDGGYNNVATVNDLSDLFVPGAIPAPPELTVTRGPLMPDRRSKQIRQLVRITNTGTSPVAAPLFLALDNLSVNAMLLNADGSTTVLAPLGSPYVNVRIDGEDGDQEDGNSDHTDRIRLLRPHESATVLLKFLDPSGQAITYDTRTLSATPTP